MAVIGERVAGAPTAGPSVSDSDSDHECPEKEPEFVIDIVDSLSQPLIPPHRHQPMQYPAAFQQPQQLTPWLRPLLQQLEKENANKAKECTNCFICKLVHCILVLVCVGVTLMMAARLPGEYKKGDGGMIMTCPILIAVIALHWLMLSVYEREQC